MSMLAPQKSVCAWGSHSCNMLGELLPTGEVDTPFSKGPQASTLSHLIGKQTNYLGIVKDKQRCSAQHRTEDPEEKPLAKLS